MFHVRFARRTILAAAALALPLAAAQAVDKTGGVFNTLYAGLGAKGYDVVAYHTLGKPTPGKAEFQQAHGGVTWQFALPITWRSSRPIRAGTCRNMAASAPGAWPRANCSTPIRSMAGRSSTASST